MLPQQSQLHSRLIEPTSIGIRDGQKQSGHSSPAGVKRTRPALSVDTHLATTGRPSRQRADSFKSFVKGTKALSNDITARAVQRRRSKRNESTSSKKTSTQTSTAVSLNKSSKQQAPDGGPTIFITPAGEAPTACVLKDGTPSSRKRVHNQILSKVAPDHRVSLTTCFEQDLAPRRKSRVLSSSTLFEEDTTAESNTARFSKFSGWTPMTATSQRSRGWWNVITTPFITSANSKGFQTSPAHEHPQVPALRFGVHAVEDCLVGPAGGIQSTSDPGCLPEQPSPHHLRRSMESSKSESHSSTRGVDSYLQIADTALLRSQSNTTLTRTNEMYHGGSHHHLTELSPYDREVPLMLAGGMDDVNQRREALQPCQSTGSHYHEVRENNIKSVFSPDSDMSASTPASKRSQFSPVIQIAPSGTVVTGRPLLSGSYMYANVTNVRSQPMRYSPNPAMPLHSSRSAPVLPFPLAIPSSARASPLVVINDHRKVPTKTLAIKEKIQNMQMTEVEIGSPVAQQISTNEEKHTQKDKDAKTKRAKHNVPEGKRTRRRCCFCCLVWIIGVLLLVILVILLAVLLPRRAPLSSISSNTTNIWVNLTTFPPIPTGVLTIARPNLLEETSNCVNPTAMWSCAVPKEQQSTIVPNSPNQPNFVLSIAFDESNSSVLTNEKFQPSPAPPTLDEQTFLGNTTDLNTSPEEGEATPFFISFLPTPNSAGLSTKVKRQENSTETLPSSLVFSSLSDASSSEDSFPLVPMKTSTSMSMITTSTTSASIPNLATSIPQPSTNPDGTALPANLLPFPQSQPLRLYNRGLSTEHYGFYTYFDRNIFMRSITLQNGSQQLLGDVPADAEGGSAFLGARARCTWRETRFLVQIWTRLNMQGLNNTGNDTRLLDGLPASTIAITASDQAQSLIRPGSFPLPVTITLDRHGGSLTRKMLFCYGLDDRGRIEFNERLFQPEDREVGGSGLINPAQGPFTAVKVSKSEGGPGGIDGGSGGCKCAWQNF